MFTRFKNVFRGMTIGTIINMILSVISARIIEPDSDWLIIAGCFIFVSLFVYTITTILLLGVECLYDAVEEMQKEKKEKDS